MSEPLGADPHGLRTAADYFAALPAHRIDQSSADYHPTAPCCVGAHLAHAFGVAAQHDRDYLTGAEAWAQAVGGNRAHVVLLLRAAGAHPYDPFGMEPWPTPPAEVFRRLRAIETLPELRGAHLQYVHLTEADLSGMDFTGAHLECAFLCGSTLTGASFRETDLTSANLSTIMAADADFSRANLYEATLLQAKLQRAKFHDADLRYADLTAADLTGADLTATHLAFTDLTQADLTRADLRRSVAVSPTTHGTTFTDVRLGTDDDWPVTTRRGERPAAL